MQRDKIFLMFLKLYYNNNLIMHAIQQGDNKIPEDDIFDVETCMSL